MDLLDKIYGALDDEELYSNLPNLIAREVGARSCNLQLWSKKRVIEEQMFNYFSADMGSYYEQNHFDQHDKWAQNLFKHIGWGNGFLTSEWFNESEFLNSIFYNEFLKHFGDDSVYCLGSGQLRPDGGVVVIGTHRGLRAGDFDQSAIKKLEAIMPHVSRLAIARLKLASATAKAHQLGDGLDAFGEAIILLDSSGMISFANQIGETLLRTKDLISVSKGRLSLASSQDNRKFQAAIKSSLTRVGSRGGAFVAISCRGEEWRIHVQPRQLGPTSATMIILERASIPANAQRLLEQIYKLTTAEARVAVGVAEGNSAQAVADRLGVSLATVRTHLQHSYSKLGIGKASEIAKIVASLPHLGI